KHQRYTVKRIHQEAMKPQSSLKGLKTPPKRPVNSPLASEEGENNAFWEEARKLSPNSPAFKLYDS
ncbi:MAG TPA: hypothetical protein QF784_04680, partial [Prochlorococcaceae cyanobacterium Fu_MAG_134]|nr:hypothetical protein [Prochlorococcaceae cyanobacterium Fu_MAG_134]